MENDDLNPLRAFRQSNLPSEPLPDDVRQEKAVSLVWQDRAEVALQGNLEPDLLALLVQDEEETVRHMLYNLHRDIPSDLLEAVLDRHPEDAASIAFQVNAPLAALRLKPFDFASPDDIERYLTWTGADADQSRVFRSISKTSDNALLTLEAVMESISR